MRTRLVQLATVGLSLAVLAVLTTGCSKDDEAKKDTTAEAQPAAEEATTEAKPAAEKKAEATPKVEPKTEGADKTKGEVEVKLAKADAFDGTTDKIVSKCAGCKLGMNGSSEHAVKVAGYTLHFCSGKCKGAFEKDTTKSVLAMNVPD